MADWLKFWENNETNWHGDNVTQELIEYFELFELEPRDKVFVPLCGKSLDMLYIMNQGFSVIGVEISEIGVRQFFNENNLTYKITKVDDFDLYSTENLEIYCGDFFALTSKHLNKVKSVFDRKSLIALEPEVRQKYVKHLNDIISVGARILLVTLQYPQHQMSGPPFSVNKSEVESLFSMTFESRELRSFNDIENGSKLERAGVDYINNAAYCLRKVRM
ncbi:MAG: thiopurine S-methyltransferase [Gammaproteobacteria bacterium]|jgi:thiopurine S-methyltransferase|nr:thiopurine S-methyltransferase [Gammaproteobacteria bacterium]MDP6973694.1 thiopurine S-methyltransferase [Gammaproteobacteria bacterium]